MNLNQIWISIFFHLISNDISIGFKQLVGHESVFLSFCNPSCSTAACKGSVFLQFCDKIQSSIHQIFTQMYLSFYRTESFIKKFFFRWHLSAFETSTQQKSSQTGTCQFTIHPLSSKTIPEDTWTQSLITNFLSIKPPQYESNITTAQARFTDHHKARFLIACSNFKL